MVEDGAFVIPGDFLGFGEEFMPGVGAYEEEGKLYSAITGVVALDMKERKIGVSPKTAAPIVPKENDIVFGKIVDLKPQVAIVQVSFMKGLDRSLPGDMRGRIHISQVRDSYVSELTKEFKAGDIIAAKIVNPNMQQLQFTTVDKNLGVVKAFCSFCNKPLKESNNVLKCEECGRTERRKISSEYRTGEV